MSAYQELIKQAEHEVATSKSSTIAQRKLLARQAIEEHDNERLADLEEKASALVATITANVIDLSKPRLLSKRKAESLMSEILDSREIQELLAVRKEMIREAVFTSLNIELAESGVEDPENTNGTIPVPKLGKKFCREGCGPKDPNLNEDKLMSILGEDRFLEACETEVVPAQVIPEHIEYSLSIEKLMKLAESDPGILEVIRECLEVGGWKSPRFTIKDL